MRLLLDQDIERWLGAFLRDEGHDLRVVGVDEPPGLPDTEVLARAYVQVRVLLTKDRDFGELVVRQHHPYAGVIFRVRTRSLAAKCQRLAAVLLSHESDLRQFIVVTDQQVRVLRTR